MSYLHRPYSWGGDDPSGFDCSGLVLDILRTVGRAPRSDMTADGIYRFFSHPTLGRQSRARLGALSFYGTEKKIVHIGFCLDELRMIHASGGGSHVKTYEDAIRNNAFVRIDTITYRRDFLKCIYPFYESLQPPSY